MNLKHLTALALIAAICAVHSEEGDDPFYPKIVDPYRPPEESDRKSSNAKQDDGMKIRRRPQPRDEDANDRPPPPPRPPSREQLFKMLDANGDGIITKEEFMANMPPPPPPPPQGCRMPPEDFFKQLDKNGDGKLSIEEFRAAPRPPPPPGLRWEDLPTPDEMFARLDANQDGSLSVEEFKRGRLPPPPPQREGNFGKGESNQKPARAQQPRPSQSENDKSEF